MGVISSRSSSPRGGSINAGHTSSSIVLLSSIRKMIVGVAIVTTLLGILRSSYLLFKVPISDNNYQHEYYEQQYARGQPITITTQKNKQAKGSSTIATSRREQEDAGGGRGSTTSTTAAAVVGILQKPKVNLHLNVDDWKPPQRAVSKPTTAGNKEEEKKNKDQAATMKANRKDRDTSKEEEKTKNLTKIILSNTTTTTTSKNASSSSCDYFKYNSQAWLNGPRHSNMNETLMLETNFAKKMILDMPNMLFMADDHSYIEHQYWMSHTICPSQSRFRNVSDSRDSSDSVILWRYRLVYMATMYHQNQHAIQEAQSRYSNSECTINTSTRDNNNNGDNNLESALSSKGIGQYDYECPQAKYLIVSPVGSGLGINIRGGIVRAMLAALTTNRTLLIVSNVQQKQAGNNQTFEILDDLTKPWKSASCHERQDYQCFFMAPTPCVLSHADIQKAHKLKRKELATIWELESDGSTTKKKQKVADPKHMEQLAKKKVWYMPFDYAPANHIPNLAKQMLYQHSVTLIKSLGQNDPRLSVITKAAQSILEPDDLTQALPETLALAIYFLRPNLSYGRKVNDIFNDISKPVGTADFERTIGLLIRASDKCGHESDCLSFADHMKAITALVKTNHPKFRQFGQQQNYTSKNTTSSNFHPTIVFTTESKSMIKEQQDFMSLLSNSSKTASLVLPFDGNFQLATNTHDVLPDTGSMLNYKQKKLMSQDQVMLSAVSTLKFQLLPGVTVGNCCSNFHILLLQLLKTGCGASPTSHFHCMHDNEDPLLRMCCAWRKDCQEEKRLAKLKLQEQQEDMAASNN